MTSPLIPLTELPSPVCETILAGSTCEFATITAEGTPLDTPMLYNVAPGGGTIDVSTGVSYPTKAERARRNPRVGLLIEAPDSGPVVSISAWAAVRDADLTANAVRYARDFRDLVSAIGGAHSWDVLREAVWYWARIFIWCAPHTIRWWPSAAEADLPALRWDPPATVSRPSSDPAPAGPPSAAARWAPPGDWRARADEVVGSQPAPHLTLVDADGFPLPFRTASATPSDNGFELEIPEGAPWEPVGVASLCFGTLATFTGRLDGSSFLVERLLPDLPLVTDTAQIFDPTPPVRAALLERLEAECARRSQPVPVMPIEQP